MDTNLLDELIGAKIVGFNLTGSGEYLDNIMIKKGDKKYLIDVIDFYEVDG